MVSNEPGTNIHITTIYSLSLSLSTRLFKATKYCLIDYRTLMGRATPAGVVDGRDGSSVIAVSISSW